MKNRFLVLAAAALLLAGSLRAETTLKPMTSETPSQPGREFATFGGGCFWCTEAAFELVEGVKDVVSGYAGGHTENPTYKDVCTGQTGHAEVIRIEFDPRQVSYERLLELFWVVHDPTSLNRQGADIGTQYRSIIQYHSEAQKTAAEKSKAGAGREFSRPIVTEIAPVTKFYAAEAYHQDYFRLNPTQGYCQAVIAPKIKKLKPELAKPVAPTPAPSN
jgi:peptide-methionine (S)-S-oxide reductase